MMKVVARRNNLKYGRDVKLLTVGKSNDFKEHIMANMNMTQYAVLFCAESWQETLEVQTFNRDMYNRSLSKEERKTLGTKYLDFYMPCQFEHSPGKDTIFYSLMYNMSLQENSFFKAFSEPFWKDNNLLSLKTSLDNAVLEIKS
jgi:hypothetical protein